MKSKVIVLLAALLAGCETMQPAPQEPVIPARLQGTAIEVQQFIETRLAQSAAAFRFVSATDRAITFQADCDQVIRDGMRCALIMMGIGNTGWAGPHAVLTFRTSEIRGTVHVSMASEWCATNALGRTNCRPADRNSEINAKLRELERAYEIASSSIKKQ